MQAIGLGAAIDYVNSIGKARIRAHEGALVKYAHERLGQINSLRIIGHAPDKGPIVSFEMKGAHPHDVATILVRGPSSFSNSSIRKLPSSSIGAHLITAP